MKKYIYFLLSVAVLTLNGCLERDEFNEIYKDQGNIIINFNTSNGLVVKSEDTSVEHRVDWIDIFIFDENNVLQHKERCDKRGNPDYQQGYFTTNRKRENFEANKKYFVFLIANSIADFSSITISSSTLGDLQRVVERNENLHLSGFGITDADNVNISPERFLMDGVAYTGTTEPEQPMTMVLNDGNLNANTELKATLRRAASKIIVNITQGDNVEFFQKLPETGNAVGFTQYSFYQLPVGTTVIAPLQGMASYLDDRINTSDLNPNGTSFLWGTDTGKPKLTITGYAYANDWSSAEMTKESSLLLNVPMKWDHDNDIETTKEERPNNWFKIPLSRESTFERNKCYVVNININAIGAENKSSAIELDNIEYVTADWITTNIDVGSTINTANYLMLNTDVVEMFNTNIDLTSLNFSSSSLIKSITLKDVYSQNEDGSFTQVTDGYSAYYINKFGVKTTLDNSVQNTIIATPEINKLNGAITIISPIKNTTQEERNTAIQALGPQPENPGEMNVQFPDPNSYIKTNDREPNNAKEGDQYYQYRYNNGIFQVKTFTYTWSMWGYYWYEGQWVEDAEATKRYNDACQAKIDEYLLNHPEYASKKAIYDAYIAAYNAIINTQSVGETHYNTIRYLEFEVENMTGQTATFRVMQYPTIYITNIVGSYSYRDDFKSSNSGVTTYINGYSPYYNACKWNDNTSSFSYANVTDDASGYLFRSKFYNESQGDIDYYFYRNGTRSKYEAGSLTNPRMYYVRVTATSQEYTIGKPRLVDENGNITNDVENGYTSSDAANSKLVSASFMIASQLGATQSPGVDMSDKIAADKHCKEYVEVAADGTEYHDWRLPTASEIDIIIKLQNASLSMDEVLSGQSYWSASGIRNTNIGSGTGRIRCVRDAY